MIVRPERVEMSTLEPAVEGRGTAGNSAFWRWFAAPSSSGFGMEVGREKESDVCCQ